MLAITSRSILRQLRTKPISLPTLISSKPLLKFSPIKQHIMPLVTINQSVVETLKKHEVIPDVIDDFEPTTMISVFYTQDNQVSLGNTLTPEETQGKPSIQFTPEADDKDATYTLVLTDPDAPSRTDFKWSEFCHWIQTDIKPKSIEALAEATSFDAMSISGKDIVEYMGPAPPPNTGKHRYVFLLYRNSDKTKNLKGPSDDERKNWGTSKPRHGARQWAEKNGLTLVGANFYFAQNSKN